MRRAATLVAIAVGAAALAVPTAAGVAGGAAPAETRAAHDAAAPGPQVSIAFAAFAPPHLDAVSGDTVRWANDSVRAHDVVALDAAFDSGRMVIGDAFEHVFAQPGTYAYYCSIHPFMTGEVVVSSVLLDPPAQRGGSGKPYVLSGRAAPGVRGSVAIEGDDGAGFRPAGAAPVAADGTFRATVVPRTTTAYRARAGSDASPPVELLVLDHAVTVTAVHRGRDTAIAVRVAPAAPGEPVVLQLRLRDRFGWWPVAQGRLDRTSTARFVVRRRHAAPGRVLLTLADGATELARSRTVRVGPLAAR